MKALLLALAVIVILPAPLFAKCDGTVTKGSGEKDALVWQILDLDAMNREAVAKSADAMNKLRSSMPDASSANQVIKQIEDLQSRCLAQVINAVAKDMVATYSVEELRLMPEFMSLKEKESKASLSAVEKTRLQELNATGLDAKFKTIMAAQKKYTDAAGVDLNAELPEIMKGAGGTGIADFSTTN